MGLPDAVTAMAARGPAWADWVDTLPALRRDLLERWGLRPDGDDLWGNTALVTPVLDEQGARRVLKLAFPDEETAHEHRALAHWGGRGAVRLLRAEPSHRAMLLERLTQRSLREEWDVAACEVVAGLYADLHVPGFRPLPRLSTWMGEQGERLAGLPRAAPLPRRLVEQATSLARAFAQDPATDGTVVHTDLHYDNVLADEDGRWVAIDPKPLDGDPHVELAPMLWNRYDEVAGSVRSGLRTRFLTLVDAAGLDEERARDWVVVRMLLNALWQLEEDPRSAEGREWITVCLSVAKAVQE